MRHLHRSGICCRSISSASEMSQCLLSQLSCVWEPMFSVALDSSVKGGVGITERISAWGDRLELEANMRRA